MFDYLMKEMYRYSVHCLAKNVKSYRYDSLEVKPYLEVPWCALK